MASRSRKTLSAIIIARNEADDLPACLDRLGFCDEIVVVEHGSDDGTADIARRRGCRVIATPDWPGFGVQKQRALDAATGDWVLSIDADEIVPEPLAAEIRKAVDAGARDGFRLARLSTFLGREMRHGGWFPDRILRLARRDAVRFSDDVVHERMIVDGPVGDLTTPLRHRSYRDIDEVLDKQRRYALASAETRRARGHPGGLGAALSHSTYAFLRHYVLQRGFLDGQQGFVAAVAKAQETFWRYLAVAWER